MDIEIAKKIADVVFADKRYKVLYGGRGSGRSWGCARALLAEGYLKKHRILCAREFQNSIGDSVHQLLSQQIIMLGLSDFYTVQNASIIGKNGTEFIFAGLRHNISKIKSFEGISRCWIEEAQTVSKTSWDTLIPTIRWEAPDGSDFSQIWITFNPELETDETYKRFVLNPPTEAKVQKMNWSDNPWFPEVLRQEKDDLQARDPDAYLNVWEGYCRQTVDGAIYAKELRAAQKDGRITKILPLPGKPVETFWDLGKRDHTAIWFAQVTMGEYRILDFYQGRGEDLPHYFRVLRDKGYTLGTFWLPHDAAHDRLGATTIEKQIKAVYPNNSVRVIARMANKTIGIQAARTIFPNCYFDEEKTADGLQSLRHFKFEVDPDTGAYSSQPLHDENSDAADAFAQLALSLKEKQAKQIAPHVERLMQVGGPSTNTGWMGS